MDPKVVADRIQNQVSGYLSDFSGQSEPYTDVLAGKHKDDPVIQGSMKEIQEGKASLDTLARAYKQAPHSPPAVLFKYIAHRAANLDKYNSPSSGHESDHAFFSSIRKGDAEHSNFLVTPRHLNMWMAMNPGVIEHALANKEHVARRLPEVGLNVKVINSEPYVAMTRGLDTPVMGEEMPLVSTSDMHDAGFGAYQHHIWFPVKDLWYSYPMGPESTWGEHGHENEWVFGNSGPRYQATIADIRPSTLAPLGHRSTGPWGTVNLDQPLDPNLTPEQLIERLDLDPTNFYNIVSHPNANDAVYAQAITHAVANKKSKLIGLVAHGKNPGLALHKYLIEGLDKNEDFPARKVGDAFEATKGLGSSRAFNNSTNSERYLRAIADYFSKHGEEASSPSSAYGRLLNYARMSDTSVAVLSDMAKTHKSLPGTDATKTKELVAEMARWNDHLTPRQLIALSQVPECALGLLSRRAPLPSAVQEGIARNGEPSSILPLASREDLAPLVADELLKRFKSMGNTVPWVRAIAENPRIPAPILEKHLTEDAPFLYQLAITAGLAERKRVEPNIVLPLPVGGVE